MKKVEVQLPDLFTEQFEALSKEEIGSHLEKLERLQSISQKREEAGLRKYIAYYLLVTGSIVLSVSLALIVLQAFGITNLPNTAIATLIGSVAVEFIGMLWMVVRYLFQ